MLKLIHISKKYKLANSQQLALDDISLNFRDNEFVSILGPSGSGKTTLLNIIGGLDQYNNGDLLINNISTKKYTSRDWDSYRNHTIGFVFQNYNLIPHQTILANVELALTIGGVSKKQTRKRAKEVLEKVGLKDQIYKKPNQLSGGQMQRVAIARALVNDPKILLADEPTGALDTKTSIQVMELLKEVANDRLVIMVTHNPELAKKYSTRIVNLRDGKITGDSNPYVIKKEKNKNIHMNLGKASMSYKTAFGLSLKNLLTKKGRTLLTSFAGSIGIIGIALILSVSTGCKNYINKTQEDALSSYPLTIRKEDADITSMLLSTVVNNDEDTESNIDSSIVKESQTITNMFTKIGTNDIKSFKEYLKENEDNISKLITHINYKYSPIPMIYTNNNGIKKVNPSTMMTNISSSYLQTQNSSAFFELIDNNEICNSKYTIIKGNMPTKYNELLLILPSKNQMSDMLAYSIGLRDMDEFNQIVSKLIKQENVEELKKPLELSYDDLMNLEYKLIDPTDLYKYNQTYNIYEDMSEDQDHIKKIYNDGIDLKIVGIAIMQDNKSDLNSGIGYTKDLTKYIIEKASKSQIVQKQIENADINVFSNKNFNDQKKETNLNFDEMISVDTKMLSESFGMQVSDSEIRNITSGYIDEISKAISSDSSNAYNLLYSNLETISKDILHTYINDNSKFGFAILKLDDVDNIVNNYLDNEKSTNLFNQLESNYVIPSSNFKMLYKELITSFLKQYISLSNGESEGENNQIVEVPNTNNSAILTAQLVDPLVDNFINQEMIKNTLYSFSNSMQDAIMQKTILSKVGELSSKLIQTMAQSFNISPEKIASAFKFNLSENEISRLINTMSSSNDLANYNTNLLLLNYQDINDPTAIEFYFKDFDSKEKFLDLIKLYNKDVKKENSDKEIKYTDLTGILIKSVQTIVDSISYVLIAFVSISLIVSSIMIGIITYISVLERTKEIGILRAIGASKINISSIFNAETFIIGLLSGIIGIVTTQILLFPINKILFLVTNNQYMRAYLPKSSSICLIVLSVIFTLIGGIIPSKHASKKDPVLALRSE